MFDAFLFFIFGCIVMGCLALMFAFKLWPLGYVAALSGLVLFFLVTNRQEM